MLRQPYRRACVMHAHWGQSSGVREGIAARRASSTPVGSTVIHSR